MTGHRRIQHRARTLMGSLARSGAALVVVTVAFGAMVLPAQGADLTDEQKTFYYLGVAMQANLGTFALTDDELALVVRGLQDAQAGKAIKVDEAKYNQKLQMLNQERMAATARAEKVESDKFIAEAAGRSGAVKTDSGLIYIETMAGAGASPIATDTVKVHYHGTLRDGSVFDSSVERGQPAEFPLNRVIPCWTEGVALMKVGGKSTLVCPPDIAYGERGSPPRIPGNSALTFEVELIEIK